MNTDRLSSDAACRALSARTAELSELEPFVVEVQRREHTTIVQPRGELDMATVPTLRTTLDAAVAEGPARLVLDLRGLSFIDSNGLHLLVALHRRSLHDGFQLAVVAPAAPVDRAIQICGLDRVLPFVAAADAAH